MGIIREHWTPRYLIDRATVAIRQKAKPTEPWLTSRSIALLEKFLCSDHLGAEFGSGRSTLWLARRCRHLISVENNPEWHRNVSVRLEAGGIMNVESRLRETGSDYISAIDDVVDESLDFVLIDGKRRLETATRSVSKIVPGGMLILDNADRFLPPTDPEWSRFDFSLSSWDYTPTTNGVWRTDIWVKK